METRNVRDFIYFDDEWNRWVTFDENYDYHSDHETEEEAIAELIRYSNWLETGEFL